MQLRAFAPASATIESRHNRREKKRHRRRRRRRRSYIRSLAHGIRVCSRALVPWNIARIIFRRGRVCVISRPRDPPRLDRPSVVVSFSPRSAPPRPAIAFSLLSATPVSLSVASFVPLSLYAFSSLTLSLSLSRSCFCFSVDWTTRRDETRRDETRKRAGPHGAERSGAPEMNHLKLSIFERGSCTVHVPTRRCVYSTL